MFHKTLIYCFICLCFFTSANAASEKQGIINVFETWSDTVIVTGDVTISSNGKVLITPGTVVEFSGSYSVTVNGSGSLTASGTQTDSIFFIALNKQTGWKGLTFSDMDETADSSVFTYCRIQDCISSSDRSAILVKKFNKIRMDHCFIVNCKNNYGKGAGFLGDSCNAKINHSCFKLNFSGRGGAMSFLNSKPVLENCTFDNNEAYWDAGALYFYSSEPVLNNCLITNNYVGSTGGEAMFFEESKGMIVNSRIINNRNTGLTCYHSPIYIVNTVIANNDGRIISNYAGGIYLINSHPTIINSTITNNFGYTAGGIYCYFYSHPKIINSIIWNNYGKYNEIGPGEYDPLISHCNIRGGNSLNLPPEKYIQCISEIPLFKNPSSGIGHQPDAITADWSLKSCSPCINKGINDSIPAGIVNDFLGNPRIINETVDIGAFESLVAGSVSEEIVKIYVKESGSGDGSSWQNAMGSLQQAINTPIDCNKGIEIWVAAGTYYPDTTITETIQDASLELRNHVKLIGGFQGTETSIEQRNLTTNVTVLSGNVGVKSNHQDNIKNVISASFIDSSCVLDGFTVTGGYAYESGSGMIFKYASPVLRNVTFVSNSSGTYGGAIYLTDSDPVFSNCGFFNNQTYGTGGCGYLNYSNAVFLNCRFINNKVAGNFSGGAFNLQSSQPSFINSIFANNQTGSIGDGGALYCQSSNPKVVNCIFSNNLSFDEGGSIFTTGDSRPVISNSVFWQNTDQTGLNHFDGTGPIKILNSLVQGGNKYKIPSLDYLNNIDDDPLFIQPTITAGNTHDALTANWNVTLCSPLIDAGDKLLLVSAYSQTDLEGKPRIINEKPDIGPFESDQPPQISSGSRIIYVKPGGQGDGSSWQNAMGDIQNAVNLPRECVKTNEIWVAEGIYKPGTEGLNYIREATFRMINHVKLYGGFSGTESNRNERNIQKYPTVLSGDIGEPGNLSDNCFNTVTFEYTDTTCLLDGFTIVKGNSNIFPDSYGAGILCNHADVTLRNVILKDNRSDYKGAALYAENSVLNMVDCSVINNISEGSSGCSLVNSAFTIAGSLFSNNSAEYASCVELTQCRGQMINCILSNNLSSAICSNNSNYSIVNSSVLNNDALFSDHGDLLTSKDTLRIVNSIFWNNENSIATDKNISRNFNLKFYNCDIQNGNTIDFPRENYVNNVDIDPYFEFPSPVIGLSQNESADWHLKRCSPCINSGLNNANTLVTDMDGNTRIYGGTIDMGPYELQNTKAIRPTDILLTNDSIPENYQIPLLIGNLIVTDEDSHDFTFSFSNNQEYYLADSIYFSLSDSSLNASQSLPVDRPVFYAAIKATDETDCSIERQFLIYNLITANDNFDFKNKILFYPNPSKGNVYMDYSSITPVTVNIYDLAGYLVYRSVINEQSQVLHLQNLPKGVYIIEADIRSQKTRQVLILN
ncbi:MAG TPA: choice-of-anchor Q domain-containing protein [Bacteroidales bacterium]|nr:choice-of-anchor Q domain-containing protein [Bacteroidales bacterium]